VSKHRVVVLKIIARQLTITEVLARF